MESHRDSSGPLKLADFGVNENSPRFLMPSYGVLEPSCLFPADPSVGFKVKNTDEQSPISVSKNNRPAYAIF